MFGKRKKRDQFIAKMAATEMTAILCFWDSELKMWKWRGSAENMHITPPLMKELQDLAAKRVAEYYS